MDRETYEYKKRYLRRVMCILKDTIKVNVTQVTQKGFVSIQLSRSSVHWSGCSNNVIHVAL